MVATKTRLFLLAVPIMAGFVRRAGWRRVAALGRWPEPPRGSGGVRGVASMGRWDAWVRVGGLRPTFEWLLTWTVWAPTELRGHLGLVLDQEFGVLLSAPVIALSLAGAVVAARERRWRYVLLTAGPFLLAWYYLGAVALSRSRFDQHWHAGFSLPGRFVAARASAPRGVRATMLDPAADPLRVDRRPPVCTPARSPDGARLDPPGLAIQPRRGARHAAGRALRVHGARCRAPAPLVREPGPRVGGARARGPRDHRAGRPPGGAESGRGDPAPPGSPEPRAATIPALALPAGALALAGRDYPAAPARGRDGAPFHGIIQVDTGEGAAARERLVWAARRTGAIELAPRLQPGRIASS